ncbi:MAG: TfoX/Sxy family protein [Spirochaetia bacterium]|nr:TfoX/Sxy family protein [Spirochaetia bacterium]
MPSTQDYCDFVLDQLSLLSDITTRKMMGEYILYYNSKIFGGIYDNRFLVKPVEAAKKLMPDAPLEIPYPGGKKMLLVEDIDNREFLKELIIAICDKLPAPKAK